MSNQDPREKYPRPDFPEQTQEHPGLHSEMEPEPDYGYDTYRGHGRLEGKAALVTGGDSGIGRGAYQVTFDSFDAIDDEQLRRTFDTNILAMFWLTQAALPHLQPGSAIVNVASIQANGEVLGVTGGKPLP